MNNNSLFQGYQVGQTAFFEKKILEEHIIQFATVTLTKIEPKSRLLTFDTNCHVSDKLVVTGSAKI